MKKINNKAFSLVELIITFAIMAVLVGVMAPQYMKYLDKTKKTLDCKIINTVLDACVTLAMDPHTTWNSGIGDKITIRITSIGTTYSGDAAAALEEVVPAATVVMEAKDWGIIEIDAVKNADGSVDFDISNNTQITVIAEYSTAIAERLE